MNQRFYLDESGATRIAAMDAYDLAVQEVEDRHHAQRLRRG
ncbi:MAG: hypothetical protein ACJ74O_07325 [Frankiaceae bacterium]